jgi:hypothetical protein
MHQSSKQASKLVSVSGHPWCADGRWGFALYQRSILHVAPIYQIIGIYNIVAV